MFTFSFLLCNAQNGFVLDSEKSSKVNFKLINNLIVIPVEVNGINLSFLLDTGVSKPIIFNLLNFTEKLEIKKTEKIYLRGLGEGETVEALKSSGNVFKIGEAVSFSQDLFAIHDPTLNFAPRLGLPIHGIIGYDLLQNLIVEVNYSKKYLKISNHDAYKSKSCKKCVTLDLELRNNKPYINGDVELLNNSIPVNLLMDTGGSDALWLFEDSKKAITIPFRNFDDFLGRGLSGNVYGKRSKVDKFSLGNYELFEVNVAFPDSASISHARKNTKRNGSVSGEILKRFNITFDYKNKKVTFKKNRLFSNKFSYNKSGISIEHQGVRLVKESVKNVKGLNVYESPNTGTRIELTNTYKYVLVPSYKIVELRKDSPAEKAGLMIDDIILYVNKKDAHLYELNEIMGLLYGEDGKHIRLLVDRGGVQLKFDFTLKSML